MIITDIWVLQFAGLLVRMKKEMTAYYGSLHIIHSNRICPLEVLNFYVMPKKNENLREYRFTVYFIWLTKQEYNIAKLLLSININLIGLRIIYRKKKKTMLKDSCESVSPNSWSSKEQQTT